MRTSIARIARSSRSSSDRSSRKLKRAVRRGLSFIRCPSSTRVRRRQRNAMACAAEAGFGQAFYLGLFANHTLQWSDGQLMDLATKVTGGSPSEAFKTCVTSKAHADWVSSINAAADKNGVAQTPTMLINGKSVDIANLTPDALKANDHEREPEVGGADET